MPMRERDYRQSRICRLLGNPTAYRILVLLQAGSRLQPGDIAEALEISPSLASHTLRILRNADLVRYLRRGEAADYWIKYPTEIRTVMGGLSRLVDRTSRRLRKDR